jgi:hypothetical protein
MKCDPLVMMFLRNSIELHFFFPKLLPYRITWYLSTLPDHILFCQCKSLHIPLQFGTRKISEIYVACVDELGIRRILELIILFQSHATAYKYDYCIYVNSDSLLQPRMSISLLQMLPDFWMCRSLDEMGITYIAFNLFALIRIGNLIVHILVHIIV